MASDWPSRRTFEIERSVRYRSAWEPADPGEPLAI